MVRYGYRVADFCECPREVVAIATNYIDRFWGGTGGGWLVGITDTERGTLINLVFMTALYTAMKVHAPQAMSASVVALLSRGTFCCEQVERMERVLVAALEWRLNPPTALTFVRHFLDLVPAALLDEATYDGLYELARMQIEMAVTDASFLTTRASTLAFSAVTIALQSMCLHTTLQVDTVMLTATVAEQIAHAMAHAMTMATPDWDGASPALQEVQNRLCLGIASMYFHEDQQDLVAENEDDDDIYDDKLGDNTTTAHGPTGQAFFRPFRAPYSREAAAA